jgi:hypothetical protein
MKGLGLIALLVLVPASGARSAEPPRTSCLACHGDAGRWDAKALGIVQGYREDVHAEAGLSCHDCHGGNPDPRLAEDAAAAMDTAYKPNPFRGATDRRAIPAACGRCHSDPAYMKRFNPSLRVDQEKEYWTSHHGRALRGGDAEVATCVDCHGVHRILAPGNPLSPVYPTHVAETCRVCHEDAKRMVGRKLPDGRPLPVDQYAHWRQSVHARALLEKGDLSAPTCNKCHGNHGATPPGVDSIALVCGQCHGREAQLFRSSRKRADFEAHNEMLAQAGAAGCAACHEAPAPQAELGAHALSECTSCHSNHGVVRPTVALFAPLPATPCAFCHEVPESLAKELPEPAASRRRYERTRDSLLGVAEGRKLTSQERFDWLVDQALRLPAHVVSTGAEGGSPPLRPEFERLFTKFRIGRSYYTYLDPATGRETRNAVVRCSTCHASEPGAESKGLRTAADLLGRMRELTAITARAERTLLVARRGGVETRGALAELDSAVDAQIELEVLVHTFSSGEEGPLAQKHREGLQHARAALAAGGAALNELSWRRTGLAVSSVFILLVLAGLGLKIREISRERAREAARASG